MKTLAIFSPNRNAYSETFIQAHKKLPFNIRYYYGGYLPTALEPSGTFFKFNLLAKFKKKIKSKFSWYEYALLQSLKKEKVDCVLAEYGITASESLQVIKYLKLPLIVHFHGFDASNKSILDNYANRYKEVFDYASAVVAVSFKMKEDLIKLGCPLSKLTIAAYGPDPMFLKNNPPYVNPKFTAVGRFVDKKAPYFTIAAFKKVVETYSDAKLIMIGDGALLNACKNLVKLWGLSDSVEFKGILNQAEIREVFQDSIAFVQHSIIADSGDTEGTPVAVLEAQAAALPVISTYHAGIPDVVINSETGLLVEEHDIDGMANNMLRILQEEGLARKLGVAGRQRIIEKFSRENNLSVLKILVDQACNHPIHL